MAAPNVEIADHFFNDSVDFLHRYKLTVASFCAVKSRRLKLYIDLRMAAECIMKACAAYCMSNESSRRDVIRRVERNRHRLRVAAADTKARLSPDLWSMLEPFIDALDSLPVSLRYRLDGNDFRQVNEALYYETVGSDDWLGRLNKILGDVATFLGVLLQGHSRIISGVELLNELRKPDHNKYRDKD